MYYATGKINLTGLDGLEYFLLLTTLLAFYYLPHSLINVYLFKDPSAVIGVNLLGLLVPLFISIRFFLRKRISLVNKAFWGIALVSILSYQLSTYMPGEGIVLENFILIPLAAATLAFFFYYKNFLTYCVIEDVSHQKITALAHIAGSMRVLIGSDLLFIQKLPSFG